MGSVLRVWAAGRTTEGMPPAQFRAGSSFSQVIEMQRILDSCNARTRLLVASVREPGDMARLAAQGCTTFTISPKVRHTREGSHYTLFTLSGLLMGVGVFQQELRACMGQRPSRLASSHVFHQKQT